MLNPERIWHEHLTDMSTSPVRCSHFTLRHSVVSYANMLHQFWQNLVWLSRILPWSVASVCVWPINLKHKKFGGTLREGLSFCSIMDFPCYRQNSQWRRFLTNFLWLPSLLVKSVTRCEKVRVPTCMDLLCDHGRVWIKCSMHSSWECLMFSMVFERRLRIRN